MVSFACKNCWFAMWYVAMYKVAYITFKCMLLGEFLSLNTSGKILAHPGVISIVAGDIKITCLEQHWQRCQVWAKGLWEIWKLNMNLQEKKNSRFSQKFLEIWQVCPVHQYKEYVFDSQYILGGEMDSEYELIFQIILLILIFNYCSGSLEPEYSCHDRDWIMELPM